MTTARAASRMTEAEYLATEPSAPVKREWHDGQAYAMAGGTPEHAAVVLNVGAALRAALGKNCLAFSSELRVHVPSTGLYTYPDTTVVCGGIERHADGISVLNPKLIVEVLSERTESYDRGDKLTHYESIPTLTDYVLVSTERQCVEHFRRSGPHQWIVTRYLPTAGTVPLEGVGAAISFEDVYRGWDEVRRSAGPKTLRTPRKRR